VDSIYEKVNDYGSVSIRLASPSDILSWSYGEVKKPETINYRTYRPEKDGLFCERIFGPERDWECFCGKYKGIKHRGIICDRCGIKITHSRVRRERMGHINLAAPCVHIWFFKATPSRLGNLLAMKTASLERIIYYQDYVVIDPGDAQLKHNQLLTEEEYKYCREKYGDSFEADTGAEAIRKLMAAIDLEKLTEELKAELKTTKSKQKTKDIIKRLKIVKAILDSGNQPEWMVQDVVPVIPPDLRPLVLLESGNFATSDLNDLYRRLINRNNRLKKLLDLNAPDVIIRNEKRMLQHSVDALFDNNRCRRPVLGSNNRPLKSLTDMIKGKQGRFRENLLGKRVDYSARSVIAVGPELRLHQCGLPKKIALELFQPFIIRRLKELGHADTIKSAKKMLERKDEEVWDILEEVIHEHPVLLNRAPTLHRMGIQAFEPVLIEGNAILIHPLVCEGFNADFDGDQMAVHLPLSLESKVEASTLMLSTNNVFSPASGRPIIAPSQDIVLGCYYLTAEVPHVPHQSITFSSAMEVFRAHQESKVIFHTPIKVRLGSDVKFMTSGGLEPQESGLFETTVGRIFFNDILPEGMCFYNLAMNKGNLNQVIHDCYQLLGRKATLSLLDDLKELGFKSATIAGISFSKNDLREPESKQKILAATQKKVTEVEEKYQIGVITEGERYNQIIDLWTHATEQIGEDMIEALKHYERKGKPYLNPIYVMVDSGARGSVTQIRQLAGMRGLMAKPSGEIIETPIKSSFRDGLSVLEYFSSTHGARKGLADTALKTADSGYLTRKLADVAQNVVITEADCGTLEGITKSVIYKGDKIDISLPKSITGRVSRKSIVDVITDEVIVSENQMITEDIAKRIEAMDYEKIMVRSPLTCETALGICANCYGMDRSTGRMVERGMAVGIIAAQSIGEPGTQLTMRTFHIGGVASKSVEQSSFVTQHEGVVQYQNVSHVTNSDNQNVVLNRNGEVLILDEKNRELERTAVPAGAILHVAEGGKVTPDTEVLTWEPHMIPILAEHGGSVEFDDIIEDVTMKKEVDPVSNKTRYLITEHKGECHPQIIIKDGEGTSLAVYAIPEKAYIEVEQSQKVTPGTLLARSPRAMDKVQDITGGLPRVTEIFEVRKPKNPSVIAKIDGIVRLEEEKKRGKFVISVTNEESGRDPEPHIIPPGKHFRVHTGDEVKAGDPLVDGPVIPRDILEIKGEEEVHKYLLREVQTVYRSQNVTIDDKHIEIIVSQMLRCVEISDPGDTDLLPGTVIDKFRFREINNGILKEGKKPATALPQLLGITKASLHSDSFISAASFQETTKVLTEAALSGKTDNLVGLKENVILGHLVPAGTGFKEYLEQSVKKLGEPVARQVEPEKQESIDALVSGLVGGSVEADTPEVLEE